MPRLSVCLFGRFSVQCGEQVLPGLDARKVQELFSYLLLHQGRPHPREFLAGVLWSDYSAEQSRKYLRQTLWHLQTALDAHGGRCEEDQMLRVEPDWVDVNPRAALWLDVGVFEQAFSLAQGVPSEELNADGARSLQAAVQLYQGDLLEGCYLDWCLLERVRLQSMYLGMLDKLMGFCEAQHQYEAGLLYGMRILSFDRASERTHRRLMRLKCLAGDRTAALRQYADCVAALEEELGAHPSRTTQTLYERILTDQFDSSPAAPLETGATPETVTTQLSELTGYLKQMVRTLSDLQSQVQAHIDSIELNLKRRL